MEYLLGYCLAGIALFWAISSGLPSKGFCVNCKHFRTGNYCAREKKRNLVNGQEEAKYLACEKEREAGKCGERGIYFEENK